MPETNDSFLIRAGRFRTSRFPGTVSGHVSATTENYEPAVSPTAEAERSRSLGNLGPTGSDLAIVPEDEITTQEVPTVGDTVKGLGEAGAVAGLQAAGTSFGSGTGAALATGSTLGEAVSAGGSAVSNTFTNAANAVKDFVAPAGSAPSALANITPSVKPAVPVGFGAEGGAEAVASTAGTVGDGVGSLGSSEALGSSLGAGAGAGLVSFGIGLLMGQSPKQAAIQGAATGVGTAIGYAIGGPVGGFIGGAIGGAVCYVAGTPVLMVDGSFKNVEDIDIGDVTCLGDAVIGIGKVLTDDLWNYRGTRVTGQHAVFERGKWIRVKDSPVATPIDLEAAVPVYPIVTERHLMVLPEYVASDFAEIDDSYSMTDDMRLVTMNGMTERNAIISGFAKTYERPTSLANAA